MTNKLKQIEELRQELVRKIQEITHLPVGDFEVEISFHNQGKNSPLVVEARLSDWYPDSHDGSEWFTSVKPTGGSTTVFVE